MEGVASKPQGTASTTKDILPGSLTSDDWWCCAFVGRSPSVCIVAAGAAGATGAAGTDHTYVVQLPGIGRAHCPSSHIAGVGSGTPIPDTSYRPRKCRKPTPSPTQGKVANVPPTAASGHTECRRAGGGGAPAYTYLSSPVASHGGSGRELHHPHTK